MADFNSNKPYSVSWHGVKSKYEMVSDTTRPLPPSNIFVTTPYITGVLDIRWDNPLNNANNSQFTIIGVNLYKSEDSEAGPFYKINSTPIQALYYRDETTNVLIGDEDVLLSLQPGTNAKGDWIVKPAQLPIVKPDSQADYANSREDILVRIDNGDGNLIITPVKHINGMTGEIFLITEPIYNPKTKKLEPPRLPSGSNARIYVSYWNNKKLIRTNLMPRNFYKVATVGRDSDGNILETPLANIMPSNVNQIEKPHYIWKGVIAKNRYLLEQFGERVKLFIRKENGERCKNYVETHKQAHNTCKLCYGTSFIGGYEGPFDVVIAPPSTEKHIDLTDSGLRMNFTYESWTGPSPLLRTRDFVIRQNGERMVIGSVTPQGPKGAVFQQQFILNYRDSKDIIYDVPVFGGKDSVPVTDDTRNINQPITDASPVIPEHKNKKTDSEKGRTIDYENIEW